MSNFAIRHGYAPSVLHKAVTGDRKGPRSRRIKELLLKEVGL